MSADGSILALLAAAGVEEASGPAKALRFNKADTAYLNRTPSGAGNRKTWTWSAWVKRSGLGLGASNQEEVLFASNGNSDATNAQIQFGEDDELALLFGYPSHDLKTSAKYKDTGAWYHFVVAFDCTQGTNSNKAKIYVNGSEVTSFATDQRSDYTNTDWAINAAQEHRIGAKGDGNRPFHGYMINIHLIDGLQLTPTSFAETDGTTGQWIPKEYSGAYGTNGFFLQFADNSAATAAALGKDSSGNGHNWTPNNISVVAGTGNDSLFDSPTNGDSADNTGAGGEVTGNYCTWNRLAIGSSGAGTYKQGNLRFEGANAWKSTTGTWSINSGKWYYEATITGNTYGTATGNLAFAIGYCQANKPLTDEDLYNQNTQANRTVCIHNTGGYNNFGTYQGTVCTPSNGDIIGVALDKDTNNIKFYLNNSEELSLTLGDTTSTLVPYILSYYADGFELNFGQRAFTHTAPTNYKPLCTAFLANPAIAKPNLYFDATTYTGDGNSPRSLSPFAFQPEFIWIKSRNTTNGQMVTDVIRGATKVIFTHLDWVENTESESITAFESDGWSMGDWANNNGNTIPYVAWAWDCGTSVASTSNSGSATNYTRWTNATSGFSIIKATISTGSGYHQKTIDHGLGVAPGFIAGKGLDAAEDWRCYHSSLGTGGSIYFNKSDQFNTSDSWKISATSNTQFTFDSYGAAQNMVFYVWAPVPEYSAVGTYTGSSGEPFVYTGFKPAYVLLKRSDNAGSWYVFDNARSPYNEANVALRPNSNVGDQSYNISMLSNGFLIESSSDGDINGSGANYIWFAVAESPFKYTRGR